MAIYDLEEVSECWRALAPLLSPPRTDDEYDSMVGFLDQLVDAVGDDEKHPLASLMDTVGTLIQAYDEEHYPFSEGDPIGALLYLMEEHGLTQADLRDVGSQGVVSEILSGKRSLNVRQVKALGERFHVSPSTFI